MKKWFVKSFDELVASIYSIVELKIMKVVEAVKFLSIFLLIWEFMFSKMLGLIFLILLRRVNLSWEWLGHERRKWKVVSTSFPQLQSGLSVSWNLCLNLCSWRWLSPSRSLEISFAPIGLWQPKLPFAVGFMNLRIFILKVLSVSELRMLESNLFHSIIVDQKYEFLKNWCFTLILGILSAFLVLYRQFDRGIISKYLGHWFLYTLKKRHCFLYQRLC